jgi:hypothetical protein
VLIVPQRCRDAQLEGHFRGHGPDTVSVDVVKFQHAQTGLAAAAGGKFKGHNGFGIVYEPRREWRDRGQVGAAGRRYRRTESSRCFQSGVRQDLDALAKPRRLAGLGYRNVVPRPLYGQRHLGGDPVHERARFLA